MSLELLPWMNDQWSQLRNRVDAGKLSHALLFSGPRGIGKNAFTRLFVSSLLCEQTGVNAAFSCGHCRQCQMLRAGTQPDLLMVSPIEPSKIISVDQIREVGQFVTLTKQGVRYKVVVISPADKMNVNAANSLLKSLEEPVSGVILILVTDRPTQLPATVRSRCQRYDFALPAVEQAQTWLQQQIESKQDVGTLLALAAGAPLAAVALANSNALALRNTLFESFTALSRGTESPMTVAQEWIKQDSSQILLWVRSWLCDMIKISSGGADESLQNRDLADALQALVKRVDLTRLYISYDQVNEALRLAEGSANKQLLLEDFFIDWASQFENNPQRRISSTR